MGCRYAIFWQWNLFHGCQRCKSLLRPRRGGNRHRCPPSPLIRLLRPWPQETNGTRPSSCIPPFHRKESTVIVALLPASAHQRISASAHQRISASAHQRNPRLVERIAPWPPPSRLTRPSSKPVRPP